jgi:hypothetical protein
MRLMGIAALRPKPRTTKPVPGHKIFPYLLRDLVIDRPNQVLGSSGWVRSSAWICDFSSTQSRARDPAGRGKGQRCRGPSRRTAGRQTARRSRSAAAAARTPAKCDARSRPTRPWPAIECVLQCVAAAGIVSSVVVTTSAIFSSPILRGAPGRGSSTRPSRRLFAHLRPRPHRRVDVA